MPTCRNCQKDWPAGTAFCPNDGFAFSDASQGGMAVAAVAPQMNEPPPTSDLIPGMAVGEYRIDKKIGEGGMGAVYSATHPMIGKRAAIKVISAALGGDASCVNRFVQEARSVNQIGHPNIVDVFSFGELPDGRNYFVMEYLQGESLADRLQKAPMPLGEAIEILDQVADALEAAHEKMIVHRDLKPDNVYLAAVRGGRTLVKLLDFGIAKLSTPDSEGSGGGIQKTRTGMMMGTPGYLSPEQARGKNVDHRTDIYALGCMVFEIVCGRLPFVADNAMDIVLAHMTEEPVRASTLWPEIPAALDDLIAGMLQKDPNARPTLPQARALFSELVTSGLVTLKGGTGIAFGSGMSRPQTPAAGLTRPKQTLAAGTQPAKTAPELPAVAEPAPAPAKKKTGMIAAVIAGVVLVGGAGAFFAMKGGDKSPAPQKPADPPVAAAAPTPPPPTPVVETPPPPKQPEVAKVVPATVDVAINVDGATVMLDNKPVVVAGKTAKASIDVAGDHQLTVNATGYEPFEKTVTTTPGQTLEVTATLEKTKKHTHGTKPTGVAVTKPGAGSAAATTTTTTTTAPTGGKGPDVNKDATVDPFK